jgi:NTP pyrophosphatase (non-canonical NTP hydrolase)
MNTAKTKNISSQITRDISRDITMTEDDEIIAQPVAQQLAQDFDPKYTAATLAVKAQATLSTSNLNALAVNINFLQRKNGFWQDIDNISVSCNNGDTHASLSRMALMVSEIAEAMEAVRKTHRNDWNSTEKDTVVSELAGAIIRILDFCGNHGLPIQEAIYAELKRCGDRGVMHGNKKA